MRDVAAEPAIHVTVVIAHAMHPKKNMMAVMITRCMSTSTGSRKAGENRRSVFASECNELHHSHSGPRTVQKAHGRLAICSSQIRDISHEHRRDFLSTAFAGQTF